MAGRGRYTWDMFRRTSCSTPSSSHGSSGPADSSTAVGATPLTQLDLSGAIPSPRGSQPESPLTPGNLSGTVGDDIRGRMRLRVERDGITYCFVNSNSVASRCTSIFKLHLHEQGSSWDLAPEDVKTEYWEEFKKYYWWEMNEEVLVRAAWNSKMSDRYKDQLFKWRKTKKRPPCCSEEVWNGWQTAWKSDDFEKKRAKGKANRHRERGEEGCGLSKHTCGSRSMGDHRRAMEREQGAPPSKIQLFDATHMTKLDDGTRVYVDKRAKKFGETLHEKISQFSFADGTPTVDGDSNPIIPTQEQEDELFMQVATEDLYEEDGRSHRYLYGTGANKERSMSFRSDASTGGGRGGPEMHEVYEELSMLKAKDVERAAREASLVGTVEDLKKTLAERDAQTTELIRQQEEYKREQEEYKRQQEEWQRMIMSRLPPN